MWLCVYFFLSGTEKAPVRTFKTLPVCTLEKPVSIVTRTFRYYTREISSLLYFFLLSLHVSLSPVGSLSFSSQ